MRDGLGVCGQSVSAQFLVLGSHSPGEPVSRGQLGGTVSCLKSSQFTGSFKVSTPTRGPEDHKNYKHWAVLAETHKCTLEGTHAHTHTDSHAHTHTHSVLTAFLAEVQ